MLYFPKISGRAGVRRDAGLARIDDFMAAPKRIAGYASALAWVPGWTTAQKEVRLPIEVNGELQGAQILVVGYPWEPKLQFRLGLLIFRDLICRLDYADETHPNSLTGYMAGRVPEEVRGPHYHSWPVNREYFRGGTKPDKLYDAVPYPGSGRTFDAILRWFCSDTNIDPLPPGHRIELPLPEKLL